MDGVLRCSRYAFGPNRLHFCGPDANRATTLALSTATISGASVFINKFAVGTVGDPILYAGLKNTIVAIFLVGLLLAIKKHSELRHLSKQHWVQLGTIGLVGGALPFALFFTGLAMIPAATGALIHKTLFIWVALFGTLYLHERFSPLQWLGVTALFVSNLFLGGFQGFTYGTGELLIAGATLLLAIENVLAKRALRELSSAVVAAGRMVFGSAFLIAFLVITGRSEGLANLAPEGVLWTLLTSALLLGYVLTWYTALKYAPASYVAALLVPATLVTNVLSAVFVTGTLTIPQVVPGTFALVGTWFMVAHATHLQKSMSAQEGAAIG